jgi:hypothetical protein
MNTPIRRTALWRASLPLRFAGIAAAVAIAVVPLGGVAANGLAQTTVAGTGSGGSAFQATFMRSVKYATRTYLQVPSGGVIGQDVTVVATLKTSKGAVLANQHLTLSLDGVQIKSDRTDAHGNLSITIPGKKLTAARAYAVQVVFPGTHVFLPSHADATLTVLTAGIQIQTVPPLPNLRFTLGTESAVTGVDGVATMPVPQSGTYQLNADLNPDNSNTATVKASFVRWLDNVFTANRTVTIDGPATFTMGLRVAYRASIKYVDLDNQPVDPSLIQQAEFSTGTGTDDVILNSQVGAGDVWWTASSTARVTGSLIETPVTYRALSVKMHGADVVNRGQQAWTPTQDGLWTIQLLLYPMNVQTRDAFFGNPVAGQLQLKYPDGTTTTANVGSDGTATFADLPRGQYELSLHPAAVSPPSAVALSKPQDAVLRVITFLDVAVVAGTMIAILVALYAIGRGSLFLARRRRRKHQAHQNAGRGDLVGI